MSSFPHDQLPLAEPLPFAAARSRVLPVIAVIAFVVVLLGIAVAPDRTWPHVLVSALYAVGLALGGMLFLAFHYLTSAGWSVVLKRIAEALASTLPLGAILVLATLGGTSVLYEWSHPEVVEHNPLLQGKTAYLNVPFFIGRTLLYLAAWLLFCQALIRTSRGQDENAGLAANRKSTVLSAAFMVVFIVTFSLACIDWLMSLQPEWFSTIFAAYNFAGIFVCTLATITITAILLRRQGALAGVVNEHHLHDLGKLVLAFSSFWAYLWFSQYMLIWYSNLPEEVTYYVHRHTGAWAVLSAANVIVNWAIPFLVLLRRSAKTNEARLLRVCVLLLFGHWLDLFLMVQPVFEPAAPVLGIWEIAPVIGAAALFVILLRRGLGAAALVPRGDPYLEESLQHHQ